MGKAEHLKDKSTILFRYVAEQKHVKQTDIFVEQSLFLPPRFLGGGGFFDIFCRFVCLFVSMCAYLLCDIVYTRSSVPALLTLSQETKG